MSDSSVPSVPSWPTVTMATWAEFKSTLFAHLFDSKPVLRGRFVFRGQRDATWSLSSSFDRSFPDVFGKERVELEKALLQQFRIECEAEPLLRELTADETSLLALAQHHGVPTRLLDWSESPYVAAFFAFQHAISAFHRTIGEIGLDKHVAIWALDTSHYIWHGDHGVQIVAPPGWHNDRLRLQAGKFTRSKTPFKSLEEFVRQFSDGAGALRLFLIPSNDAVDAMADIDLMGITHSSLFPGGDGRARAAISKIILQNIRRTAT